MEQTKYDVFISYSRKDYVDEKGEVIPNNEVSKIIDALTKAEISFWFDQEGIKHGEDFGAKILKYIKASKIFVFLSTVAANDSAWTRKEIACAWECKKKIIPVRIDDSPYHDSVMFRIADLDYIKYGSNPKKGCEALVDSIKFFMAEEKAAAARREAEELRRREEQERQHRLQEELRRKQQQADNLRAEINKTEEECTTLEKTLLQKQHDLSEVNHELEIKRKHLEEQKEQVKAILYEGSADSEAKQSTVKLSTTLDEEIYSFQWRHPIDSLHAMWQTLKETKRKRHWIVSVLIVFYVASIFGMCLWLLSEKRIASIIIPSYTLAILTIYSLYQLLLNKRAGIGLILMTPIAIGILVYLFSTFYTEEYLRLLLPLSLLSIIIVTLILLIRKNGKSAMSLLTGKCIFALHIQKYPIYYLVFVCFLIMAITQANNTIERNRELYLVSLQKNNKLETVKDSLLSEQDTLKGIIMGSKGDITYQIGLEYYNKKNFEQAVRWFEIAAKNNNRYCNMYAQYKLGICYEKGLGVQSDTVIAIDWYKKAYSGIPYLSEAGVAYRRLEETQQRKQ